MVVRLLNLVVFGRRVALGLLRCDASDGFSTFAPQISPKYQLSKPCVAIIDSAQRLAILIPRVKDLSLFSVQRHCRHHTQKIAYPGNLFDLRLYTFCSDYGLGRIEVMYAVNN